MIKRLWNNQIKPFVFSVGIVGSLGYGVIYYQTEQNRITFKKELEEEEKYKDTTREDNEYFGINWGYRADALIRDKLDSGDIFLIKYDCNNCLSVGDNIKCRYLQMLNSEQDYDSLAFAYRDKEGVYVIASQFGKTQIIPYFQFLAQPFLKELSMRKLMIKGKNTQGESRVLQRLVKKHFKYLKQNQNKEESPEQMAINYFVSLGLVSNKFIEGDPLLLIAGEKGNEEIEKNIKFKPLIMEYDSQKPFFIKDQYYFDSKIVIRTDSNKELRR